MHKLYMFYQQSLRLEDCLANDFCQKLKRLKHNFHQHACVCKAFATSLFSVNEICNLEVASDESVRVASLGNLLDDYSFHAVVAQDGICREMECCQCNSFLRCGWSHWKYWPAVWRPLYGCGTVFRPLWDGHLKAVRRLWDGRQTVVRQLLDGLRIAFV